MDPGFRRDDDRQDAKEHFRARRRLQQELAPELKTALEGTFPFAGADCEAMTGRVIAAVCGGAESKP